MDKSTTEARDAIRICLVVGLVLAALAGIVFGATAPDPTSAEPFIDQELTRGTGALIAVYILLGIGGTLFWIGAVGYGVSLGVQAAGLTTTLPPAISAELGRPDARPASGQTATGVAVTGRVEQRSKGLDDILPLDPPHDLRDPDER
jgi:hypothetical protein